MRRALVVVGLFAVAIFGIAMRMRASRGAQNTAVDVSCDPFVDCMLEDTNGDGIVDAIRGKIIVPDDPTAAENTAAANLAAKLGYETSGLTLPIVMTSSEAAAHPPRFMVYIGRAVPQDTMAQIARDFPPLEAGEGGVLALGGGLAVFGKDDAGLLAAADAFSSRAPYEWKAPGEKFADISKAVNDATHAGGHLEGITYKKNQPGIYHAVVKVDASVKAEDVAKAFAGHLAGVHDVVIAGASPLTVPNPKPMPAAPAGAAQNAGGANANGAATPVENNPPAGEGATPTAGSAEAGGAAGAGAAGPESTKRLDLATLFTSHGLFTGSARMPIPSSSDAKLYVPAGAAGIAMANLAARVGLETTGITLPIAVPAPDATIRSVRTQAVIAGDTKIAQEAEEKLSAGDTVAQQAETSLAGGEGEARIVDAAFEKHGALLIKGDAAGSSAALDLLSGHFPNLWEPGKPYLSLEEIRYDLHRFFSLRSGVGQAAVALYHLNQWANEINPASQSQSGPIHDVKAEVYVDLADPGLKDFIQQQLQQQLHTQNVDVVAGSLRAGTRCCDKDPNLHFDEPGYTFHQATPDFAEDFTIPWEGNRLLDAVRKAAPKIKPSAPVTLIARVSEGPEERRKLTSELQQILTKAGAKDPHVEVLCAYKQGFSWLVDEIAPALASKNPARLEIEFAKDVDESGVRAMYSPARWVQELYPVDEILARDLHIRLEKISLDEFDPKPNGPTYRVRALDASDKQILSREFRVTTAMQPYNGVMPRYEQVEVETGWTHMTSGAQTILDQRIKTDIEEYWDHYQNIVLPRVYKFVMAQAKGDLRQEYAPPFDTLKLDIHLSEPDYSLNLDKERISSLEAIQEDTFYSTDNFINMMGDLETGRPISYIGRVIPIVHASEDGKDGHVHIEFYGKLAANPLVRLSWTDARGKRHEEERNLPAIGGEMNPRLIQARVRVGGDGVESLTWLMPADYLEDRYKEWLNVEGQDQVDRSIFSVEQARGQLYWLDAMHAAGLYRDDIAYPHLAHMAMEFELPAPLDAKENAPAPRAYAAFNVPAPAHPRPMISDYAGKLTRTPIVQWDEPISPEENAEILARFAQSPGVTAYWMGRSYLGQNLWAADVMLPSSSVLRSTAKETTLKASIIYSGRQHANEVSSTSHIDRLGEQLLTDPATRAALKQVNVILHPIDNTDGAQLSIELAQITPDNLLHPGYHGSLSADVSTGQGETDPVYPESRTRAQLIAAWLPDAFLNPHGYPSHEWVQPFSEYTGWVQSREGANPGRAWWIPRGWFTSLSYMRDPDHPDSMRVTYALRDQIVAAERNVPGLLDLETRMNARYERFGQRWQPRDMFQPIVNGIRIYMALKGTPGRGGAGGVAAGSGGVGNISPDVTWDSGYTEAPDETAHGDYMKLMASAGLAFDHVHLDYLSKGKLKITRTEREVPGGVQWRVERARPILPVANEAAAQKN
jgi:Zinc carboxypeptidase